MTTTNITTTRPSAAATGSRTNGETARRFLRLVARARCKDAAATLSPDEQKLKAELVQAIQDGRVVTLGLIRQELLSGIKEKAQFDKVKTALDSYLDEPIHSADHEYAARIYNECRNQGVEAGMVDILICALAVRRGWKVLSGDGGRNRRLAVAEKFLVPTSDPGYADLQLSVLRRVSRHK